MSEYTKATNFATKDTLPVGDANKKVKGSEIDTEFNAISDAITTKADKDGPTFTGVPLAPTATAGTNTTQIATTAFVTGAVSDAKVSPAFTGTPTAPTPTAGTNTTQLATTEFVTDAVDTAETTLENTIDTKIAEVTLPAGSVITVANATAPTGWLECDGSAISRTTYADLFAAISTTYGSGDGSTTFNLPDLRGEFVRGWDNGRGVDSGRGIGTSQLDQMQQITGSFYDTNRGGSSSGQEAISNEQGAFSDGGNVNLGTGWQGEGGTGGNIINFDSADSPDARTGSETRPRNVALMYVIKT